MKDLAASREEELSGAIRVCPERDGRCPHGMACPYSIDRYHCNLEASRRALAPAKSAAKTRGQVLMALIRVGPTTAKAIAEATGLGMPTIYTHLTKLEYQKQAFRSKPSGRSFIWYWSFGANHPAEGG